VDKDEGDRKTKPDEWKERRRYIFFMVAREAKLRVCCLLELGM